MVERIRSTTFALLGITAAMGLGLVAVVSQQSWPLLPVAPLPGLSDERGGVADAVEVGVRPDQAVARAAGRDGGAPGAERRRASAHEPRRRDPQLSASEQLATAAPRSPADAPAGTPTAPAEAAPPAPSPQSSPAQAASPQPAQPPVASAPPEPDPVAVTSSTHPGNGNAYGKYKPAGGSSGKSSRSEARSPASPPAAPTAPATPAAAPSAPVESPGPKGKGNGHAYGQVGK